MAHACDYQSRPDCPYNKMKVVSEQCIAAIASTQGWNDRTLKEYCLMVYKDMGLTAELFDKLLIWYRNH